MKLVNMKNPPPDSAAEMSAIAGCDKMPEYPWGLEVRLDDEGLAKLGLELPPVGSVLMLTARVEVVETSARASKEGENKGLTLQITDMGLAAAGRDDAGKASKFWPKE
jgi:hypothetical protein